MPIRIPDSETPRFAKLLKLDKKQLLSLQEALENCPPKLRPDEVTKCLAHTGVPVDDRRDVVRILLSLYWVRSDQGMELERFVDEIAATAQTAKLGTPPDGWDVFKPFLVRLLSLERSLGVTSKALFVAYQAERHIHRTRVMTDARPVFTSDPTQPPAAFIVNHILQLSVHENGRTVEWAAALNTDDLEELKRVVERALAKEASLRALLTKTDVPTLDWGEP